MAIHDLKAYEDFVQFTASAPMLEQIAAYYLPDDAQTRMSDLLEANQNRRLTDAEIQELDDYQELGRLVRRIKIAAHVKLAQQKAVTTT